MLLRTRGVENDFPAALLLQIGAHCSGSVLCKYHPKTPALQPLDAPPPARNEGFLPTVVHLNWQAI